MDLAFSLRGQPEALPSSSQEEAPRKATSIWSSPLAMALPRPPWLRKTTGSAIRPWEISLASSPRRPEVEIFVMTPFLIWSISGACTSERLEAARCRFLKPISASLPTTRLTTLSPPRKWWWKEMVMPSFRPDLRMASSRLMTFDVLIVRPPCSKYRMRWRAGWCAQRG